MMEGLKSLNVKPEDIDCLFLTHFHGDHIGGMMKDGKVVFPKAEVYASKAEYDAWMKMPADKRAQVETTMNAYKDRLHLLLLEIRFPEIYFQWRQWDIHRGIPFIRWASCW